MKPNSTNPPKEGRSASRAISPSFRTGPRQRPSDASTDEIVRFVREYQRCKPPPSTHAISAMKTKAVLPSIERKRSDRKHSRDQRMSMSMSIDEESTRHSVESTGDMDTDSRYTTRGVTESTRDRLDPDVEYDDDKPELPYGNKTYDYRADSIWKSRDRVRDSNEGAKKRHSNYDIRLDVERLLPKSNGSIGGSPSHSRHKRGSVSNQATLYNHKHDVTSSYMDQSFLQSTLTRPTALRQLPPIINKEPQSSAMQRPSAPSPSKASPRLGSDNGSDDSSAEDVDGDGYDKVNENDESNVIRNDEREECANNDESNDEGGSFDDSYSYEDRSDYPVC